MSIRVVVTRRVAGGNIAEDWVLVEALGFFRQPGLAPDAGEGGG